MVIPVVTTDVLGCRRTVTDRINGPARFSAARVNARASIGRYLDFYNGRRPHSSLDGTTPDQAYFTPLPIRMAA